MRRAVWLLVLAAACADPKIAEYEPRTGIITGTIVYPGGTARGNVNVLLFREDALPPPQGTGRPVNFIVVPAAQIFGDVPAGVPGDFAAPFTIPTVQAGRYQVRAFLDADGDFNPTQDLLAQPTAGDVGGGHVDLMTQELLIVEVAQDRVTAQVTVSLGFVFPVERPAFAITSTPSYAVPYARPVTLSLEARAIQRGPIQMDPAKTAFLIQYADADGDGVADDVNGDHLPDLYPQVIVRRRPTDDLPGTVIIPGIIDPFPYLDALASAGSAVTGRLDVLLPPVSVEVAAGGTRTIRPDVPPGTYEVVLISGTGQTWQVPNAMDQLLPEAGDATQSMELVFEAGAPLPSGRIEGRVRIAAERAADAYVIAFSAAAPPPPVGTGRPVALGSVVKAAFAPAGGGLVEAPFAIAGLEDGAYILRGFADVDGNFSPLVELIAQPSAADFGGGSTPAIVTVAGGAVRDVIVDLGTPVSFDRPSFEFDEVELARTAFPAAIELRSHPIDVLGSTIETVMIPVALGAGDADGDNYRDLLPRVLLTRMSDAGDPRTAADDPGPIVIPGVVDPVSFVGVLSTGVPAVPVSSLRVILPPAAVRLDASGAIAQVLSPPPAGRYRVNVLSATGQTWSVPSALDLLLRRAGTPLEDPTQARFVRVLDTPVPGGSISGTVQILTAVPAGDFSVVVFAFDKNRPPPPLGAGRPVAVAVLPKAAFGGAATADYVLRGLPTGTYQVRAFLDADDDFTPWYDTKNQPDRGDGTGGHIDLALGTLRDVAVDALGVSAEADVLIVAGREVPFDRPMFTVATSSAVLDPAGDPLVVTIDAVTEQSDVLRQEGVFPIQWVDLDGDSNAEDRNGDGNPDVFPLVVAELLDPADETHATPATPAVRIPGIVNPLQFAGAGFPATDPTATGAVVTVRSMLVAFPPIAADAQGRTVVPPEGRYRITLVSGTGQTWTIPNELTRAAGTTLPSSQGRWLEVRR